jgi:hypothetical protein
MENSDLAAEALRQRVLDAERWRRETIAEAQAAAAAEDWDRLIRLIARYHWFLLEDEKVRGSWVWYISRLQGDIYAYEGILRYYEEMGAPQHPAYSSNLLAQIEPGKDAAEQARRQLLLIGRQFIEAAEQRESPWKDDQSTRHARGVLRKAHTEFTEFFRFIRGAMKRQRREWQDLPREKRQAIVSDAIRHTPIWAANFRLMTTFPEAQWRHQLSAPEFALIDQPETYEPFSKPSDLAWNAMAAFMGVSVVTLKRWMRGKTMPRQVRKVQSTTRRETGGFQKAR